MRTYVYITILRTTLNQWLNNVTGCTSLYIAAQFDGLTLRQDTQPFDFKGFFGKTDWRVVAREVAVLLSLPIYQIGKYFYLHVRHGGKQVKRSLRTSDKRTALARAFEVLTKMNYFAAYTVDIKNGFVSADGLDDHIRAMAVLEALTKANFRARSSEDQIDAGLIDEEIERIEPKPRLSRRSSSGPDVERAADTFFKMRSHLKHATRIAYENTASEFCAFTRKKPVASIRPSDVSLYREYLIEQKNSPRTVDNKVGHLRALFNFFIEHGFYTEKNPFVVKPLMTKRQKQQAGWAVFDDLEVKNIFSSGDFKERRETHPDFYYACLIAVSTGMRIDEISQLDASQVMCERGITFIRIREGKTPAAVRDVPLHPHFLEKLGFADFVREKEGGALFVYKARAGKGAGNAAGKMFSRLLEDLKITRDRLVFHSLRKYFNDFAMKSGVSIEIRCEMLGHEIDNVNVSHYSTKFGPAGLFDAVKDVQSEILSLTL